jgi:hypothetical protein
MADRLHGPAGTAARPGRQTKAALLPQLLALFLLAASPWLTWPPPAAAGPSTVFIDGFESAGLAVVDRAALLPFDPRQQQARWLGFRPGTGQAADLNPPRMSWPYHPEQVIDQPFGTPLAFTLEVSQDPEFGSLESRIEGLRFNFYAALPVLSPGRWYWRVGYAPETDPDLLQWSATQWFDLAADTPTWDRSALPQALQAARPRPSLLFDAAKLEEIRRLPEHHALSAQMLGGLLGAAEATLADPFYVDFPSHDCPPGTPPADRACELDPEAWANLAHRMGVVAFLEQLTGDPRYAGVKQRFLTLAAFPLGGQSSTEGSHPGEAVKEPSHITTPLGLYYDWNHARLSEAERAVLRAGLERRIADIYQNFAWRRAGFVDHAKLSMIGWSHEYETFWPALMGALAIDDESELAREVVELGMHYMIAVSNSYGPDEGWNEGPGYGNDKFKNLVDALIVAHTRFPQLELFRLPQLSHYVDFFTRITPLGARHSAFGNRSADERDWTRQRSDHTYRVALLTGNRAFLQNWNATVERRAQLGASPFVSSAWSTYVLPAWFDTPAPQLESQRNRVFGLSGWATFSGAAPSDLAAQQESVSLVLQARPRGGYGHSFGSDNGFDLHAYGETVSAGGGTTGNRLGFPRHSMSHNTVLIGGEGQRHHEKQDYNSGGDAPQHDLARPVRARIIASAEGETDAGVRFSYVASDAAGAYPDELGVQRFVRHAIFVDDSYLVVFDRLQLAPNATPRTFQWLYHVPTQRAEIDFDAQRFQFDYRVGAVNVSVRHLLDTDTLQFAALEGARGQVNIAKCGIDPPSCEDDFRTEFDPRDPGPPVVADAQHVWIHSTNASLQRDFLAVVVPWRDDHSPPEIVALEDGLGVRVTHAGRSTRIGFERSTSADIQVDVSSIEAGYPGLPGISASQ